MKLSNPGAEIWVPDHSSVPDALARTTDLAVVAHPDDAEILGYRGILDGFGRKDRWFTAVVVTNGQGSARSGPYAACTDEEMVRIRKEEQKKAAAVGDYSAAVLLQYTSGQVKDGAGGVVVRELAALLGATRPRTLYTHNLADKHDTHVAVVLRTIEAARSLEASERPARALGGEAWRDLDWLCDPDKVTLDVQDRESLGLALLGVFDSQITGGKRYDLAELGRRRAHATYHQSHSLDATTAMSFAMDLTPLLKDPSLDPQAYASGFTDRFAAEVKDRIARLRAR
ncbi:MAG TPA: PIG-L family deacetylase [Vicinamibacteria bacterium]|nr:PIG-L family deacetylase [Vicinamibacteria bacterium]